MEIAISIDGVPIRLTDERWAHTTEARDDLVGRIDDVLAAIRVPDWITRGYRGAKVAWKGAGRRRYLVVVYREVNADDGFVITAFYASKPRKTNKPMALKTLKPVKTLKKADLARVLRAVPNLLDLPATRMWVDYDEEADVLYLSFDRPQRATDSDMNEDGIIVHRRSKRIVGLTILDASTR